MGKQNSTYLNNDTVVVSGIIFLCIAVVSQFFGYLNPDNAWLVYVANQILAGKELHSEVIETNPPLIVYLTLIPAYFSKLTALADYHSFTLFIFAIACASLFLSFKITANISIRLGIIFVLVLYAANNFGQREHIFLMLIFPYLLTVLEGTKDKKITLISAVMAAIGFAIKPYYIVIWAVIEIFSIYKSRNFLSIFTARNFIIGALILVYLFYLFYIEKGYVENILPLMLEYYSGFKWDFNTIVKNVMVYFIFFQMPLLVTLIKYPKAVTREIILFSLCNAACIVIVLLQQKGWSNHFFPASCFGIILNLLLLVEVGKDIKPRWNKVIIISSAFVLAMALLIAVSNNFAKAARLKSEKTIETIKLLNEHAEGGYVYPLSFDLPMLFPSIIYSDAKYGSRYGHLWMLPGMYRNAELNDASEVIFNDIYNRSDDEVMLIADILADIAHNPPMLIIVAKREYNTHEIGDFKFDFIAYMNKQKEFLPIFKNYEKLTEIDEKVIYKYKSQ